MHVSQDRLVLTLIEKQKQQNDKEKQTKPNKKLLSAIRTNFIHPLYKYN